MTTRPSQPPLSRRELRQSSPRPADDTPDEGTDATGSTAPADGAPGRSTPSAIVTPGGRRARWDPSAATDTDGGQPDVPEGQDPTPASEPAQPFRQREFRPEGRRASFAPAFAPADSKDQAENAPSDGRAVEGGGADALAGGEFPGDIDLAAPERTMTRRELRILRARAEAAGLPAPDVMFLANGESTVTGAIPVLDGVAFSAPTDAASDARNDTAPEASSTGLSSQADETVVAPEADRTHSPADHSPADHSDVVPEADAAGVVTEQVVRDTEPEVDSVAARATDAPAVPEVIPALVEPDPGGSARFPVGTDAAVPAEIVVDAEPATGDHPVADDAGVDSSAPPAPGSLRPFDAMFLPPSARVDSEDGVEDETAVQLLDTASAQPTNDTDGLRGDILAAPTGAARPFGHWSTQDDEDDAASAEAALSRDVGTGVLTTHALVLPSVPDAGEPLMSPLTSTGEVMVTGMVELPKSFGSTGAHPALFDHPEVDSLIEDADREDAASGAAPIRATRAVSSTTTTRSMVEAAPTRHSRVLPILGVVGAVVIVGVALWAIGAFVFNIF